jgi:hypothetical protein
MIRQRSYLGLASIVLLAVSGVAAGQVAPENWDGLVEVKPKRMDAVFLAPGADFRPYTKLMVDPTEVAFQKDWLKNQNRAGSRLTVRIDDQEAAEILQAARSNFSDIFNEAFTEAGYQIVTAPGPDVLRVSTGVLNLYLNAPDTMEAGRTRTYTANAGEATLVIEVRDSSTNALLGRVLDRRETLDTGTMQMSSRVTNLSDFRSLFKRWAKNSVDGLAELKAHSPVPEDLKPKQKL